MYGLAANELEIQARARGFADELIPFEEEAELGGGGCTALQQVLVQEQMGRVTNALGWVASTPPSWLPGVATADQIERYVRPAIAGEREECYAITEEGAGSDVDAIEATAH